MIERLSQSLMPVERLLTGFGYVLALVFFLIAMSKLHKIGNARANASSGERVIVPLTYFLAGMALMFFPNTFDIIRNTVFGSDATLSYIPYKPFDFYSAFGLIVQTVGILWFIRGTALLAESSKPGVQHGAKAVAFLIAGIMAMNFDYTANTIFSMLGWLEKATLGAANQLGF